MKNIIKISAIACAAALLFSLAGCTTKELDTAQYSDDAVTLASFGPNPVMRGGQLRFFGSNLQDIVEVNVPGVPAITTIEVVKSGKVSEIRVTLPVEGPEVGIVSIKDKSGATYTTKSELTYTEPIVFDSFTANNPAYPGEVITLKGDYMNLVQHVVFEGGEISPIMEGATRHEAKVTIPVTAVTGKIVLSDGAEVENLIYSTEDLVIGQPTVTKIAKKNVKPEDEITFTGAHLEMIKTVEFRRMNEVVEGSLWIEDGKLHTEVPDVASDGLVMAVSYAGDKFEICEIECIMPSELVVENTPKAGDALIITGNDLDVITKVDLAGAENASFTLEDDGKLHVEVSETATDGNAKVFHPNGEFVEVAYTIVHPTITAVAPLELYAGDEPVIVTGTDLDLVTAAKIGTKDVEISDKTETKLTLATAVTSVGGKVILTLGNGETLTSEQEVKMNYHSKVIVTSRPAAEHIGMPVTLKGQGLDLVESIFIGEAKVTKYILRTAEEIQFLMPWNKVGSYELKFQLYDGDIEVQADPIEVQLELQINTAFEGSVDLAWSAPGQIIIPASKVGKVAAGSIIRLYFTQHDQVWGQIQVNDGSWNKIMPEIVPTDIYGWFPDGILDRVYDIVLTKAQADQINGTDGLVIQGSDETMTKVEIINEIPQEITVYQGPCNLTWDDTGRFGIAMTYFEQCVPGSKLIFYINQNGKWGQIQLNDGGWGNGDMKFAELGNDAYIKPDFIAADVTRVELTLTEALLSHILATPGDYFGINTNTGDGRCGMVIQGSDWTIESVAILP